MHFLDLMSAIDLAKELVELVFYCCSVAVALDTYKKKLILRLTPKAVFCM